MSAYQSPADPNAPVLIFRSESGRTEVAKRDGELSIHVLCGHDRLTVAEADLLGRKLTQEGTERLNAKLDEINRGLDIHIHGKIETKDQ